MWKSNQESHSGLGFGVARLTGLLLFLEPTNGPKPIRILGIWGFPGEGVSFSESL